MPNTLFANELFASAKKKIDHSAEETRNLLKSHHPIGVEAIIRADDEDGASEPPPLKSWSRISRISGGLW
jgi:hypothetical protein